MANKKERMEGDDAALRYSVIVSPRHPSGVFRRAGYTFGRESTVIEGALPTAIRDEPMLICTPLISRAEKES